MLFVAKYVVFVQLKSLYKLVGRVGLEPTTKGL